MLVKSEQNDTVLGGSGDSNIFLLCGIRQQFNIVVLNCQNGKSFYQLNFIQGGDYLENIGAADIACLEKFIDEYVGYKLNDSVNPIELVALIQNGSSLTGQDHLNLALLGKALQKTKKRYVLCHCVTNNESYKRLNIKLL